MKKIMIALVALVMVACAETPQDKMEKVIKAKMAEEFLTYDPIKFGEKIDTVYTTIEEATKGWWNSYENCKSKQEYYQAMKEYDVSLVYLDAMKNALDKIDSIKQNFQPELVGYTIKHSFKIDNKTHTMTFLIDKDLSKVIRNY